MRSTFKLLFYINKQKIKANGYAPVMGRITIDGKISQYSTGIEIPPDLWNAETGRAKSDKKINRTLGELELKAKLAYKKSVDTIGYVSAEIVKNAVTGRTQAKEMLLALFDEHNEEYAKRVGIDRVRKSHVRYQTTRKHIYNFLRYKYDIEDIPLRTLDMQFIDDFHFYLSTVLRLKTISLNDYLIHLRKIARLAVKQQTLKRDPFAGYRLEIPPVQHRHLNGEQLEKLMSVHLPTYRLCHTRDLFVFSVFTGLGRAEMAELSTEHIITAEDGSKWIRINRVKTKAECNIKLMDIPIRIMEKYNGEGKGDKIFYVPATCSLNRSLKIIADKCQLGCHLTYYQSRHSFATETCISNGVPIETISKMMGHTNIRTTQIYAEITNQKVRKDFGVLLENTKDCYTIPEDNMPLRVYQCGRYSGWKEESNDNNLKNNELCNEE